jgi:hypothetical protein
MFDLRPSITMPLALAALFAGCSASDPATESAAPPMTPTAAATPAAPSTTPALATTKSDTKPTPTPDLTVAKPTSTETAQFTPPFPERLELFEPPKRAQGTVKRDDEHGETVELKGFINVDQPRVILSIDGVVSPVPEGGEKYGVRVIAIQPPSVVLQRGRNRWTATLE